jgi:hypothetical protein
MITIEQYFGPKIAHQDATALRKSAATLLLQRVNALLAWEKELGYEQETDPDTGSSISGSKGGAGDGGFRLSTSATGAAKSKHKEGQAVDVFDPFDKLDDLIIDEILVKFGLWRESPLKTPGWCHLQSVPPGSGRRTFNP